MNGVLGGDSTAVEDEEEEEEEEDALSTLRSADSLHGRTFLLTCSFQSKSPSPTGCHEGRGSMVTASIPDSQQVRRE